MSDRTRFLLVPAVVAIILAGCGGSGAATVAPTGAESSAPAGAASEAPGGGETGETEEPGATPAESTTAGGGGGGGTGEACDLVTADEVGDVLGSAGMAITMNTPGDVSYCLYSDAAGNANAATSWMKRGGSGAFSLWKAGAGVQQINGLGDDAVFDPASATLLVLNGDAIVSITAGDGTEDEAQRITWARALAEIALGRM